MLAERIDHHFYNNTLHYSQYDRELASVALESRKLPDAYFFEMRGDKFVIPGTNISVELSMSCATPLDVLEYDAFQDIQTWASHAEKGIAFWISPPHCERSAQGKIIISELYQLGSKKIFSNRNVLFDGDDYTSLRVANNLQQGFNLKTRYFSDEVVRRYPILIEGNFEIADWLPILQTSIAESLQWEMIAKGDDWRESQRTLEKVGRYESIASLLQQRPQELVGNNTLSCPIIPGQQSAFETLLKYSSEGKFVRKCGNCGVEINKVIGKGYKCERCGGVYEGC